MSRSREFIALVALLAIAFWLRIDLLVANSFVIDSDEAIVGLMAKHMSEGGPIPVFYYGQHYMGSLEPIVVAVVFSLFGISTVALKMVPLFFSLLLLLVVHALTRRVCGARAALLATLLFAVPPSPLLVWSSMARGGFIEIVLIGALSLLVFTQWLQTRRPQTLFLLWLLLGIGWWVNNQILYFICAIAVSQSGILLWELRPFMQRALHLAVVAASGFLLGSLPYWYYQLSRGFPARGMFAPVSFADVRDHFYGVFAHAFPILFGSQRAWSGQELFPQSTLVSYLLYGGLAVGYVWLRWAKLCDLLRFRLNAAEPHEVVALVIPSAVAAFSFSSFGFLVMAPRYLLPIYPSLFFLSAYVIDRVWRRQRALGVILMALLLEIHLVSCYWPSRAIPGEPFVYRQERVAKDHAPLIDWLIKNEIRAVRTNYWIGYRLAFESQERIVFSMFQQPDQVRIAQYEEIAREIPDSKKPFVLTHQQAAIVTRALDVQHRKYERTSISGYEVVFNVEDERAPPQHFADPRKIRISGLRGNGNWSSIIDGNLHTRWGSAEAQHPGMELVFEFSEPQLLSSIDYLLGDWPQDYPRRLRVVIEGEDPSNSLVLSEEDLFALCYLTSSRDIMMYFPERLVRRVVFLQKGSDPVFDWSVAEVRFARY